nr:VWA domain-containing protein [uncultured Stomatobaculum sp.]
MKESLTEIVFILDRSGSMGGLETDTIGGFNAMLERQKKAEGEVLLSTLLFSNETEVLHDRADIRRVEPLSLQDYRVGGSTALLDAIGGAIRHIGELHRRASEDERPAHTLFVITTDGQENASRRYSYGELRRLIERQKEKYGWEFLFLGANMDAVAAASRFGIDADRAVRYHCDSAGIALNYEAVGEAILTLREKSALDRNWGERIREDYRKRSELSRSKTKEVDIISRGRIR